MSESELNNFIINYIDKKERESKDKNFIRYTFYDLRVKNNLSEKEVDKLLKVSRDYFQNKGYNVYFTGAKYEYKNANMLVQDNELMIAVKN